MVGGDAVSQYGDDGSIAQLQTLCTIPTITFNLFTIRDQMVPPHLNKTKILKKFRCYQDSKGANQCSWGNLILRFWRASLVLGALLRGKKLFRGVCLAQPLTFFGANCCRKLSIAACLRFGCSAVIAHFLRISATTLQYFCNNTAVFLQLHFAFFATRSIYTEAQQNSSDPKNVM